MAADLDGREYILWLYWLKEAKRAKNADGSPMFEIDAEVWADMAAGVELIGVRAGEGRFTLADWLLKVNVEQGMFLDWTMSRESVADTIYPARPHEPEHNPTPEGVPMLTVLIDPRATDIDIRDDVMALLRRHRKKHKLGQRSSGAPEFKPYKAKYPLVARPNCDALQLTLDVWRVFQSGKYETDADVAYALIEKGITVSEASEKVREEEQRGVELAKVIYTMKKRAKSIMGGVAVGKFPVTK